LALGPFVTLDIRRNWSFCVEIDVYKQWLGIPEGNRPPDHYELLRLVQFEDDLDKIQAHYKKLNGHVRKYASGQYAGRSQELLNELAKAMLCLTDVERKRDFDESMGREFEDETDGLGRKPILRYLADNKKIARAQISEIEGFADVRGLTLRDAVVQMKLVDATEATQALAQETGLPFVDLDDMIPEDEVLDQVPRKEVRRHSCLPLFVDDDVLLVACADVPEVDLEDQIRLRFGIPMRPCLATPLAIKKSIDRYYAPGVREESQAGNDEPVDDTKASKKSTKKQKPKKPKPKKAVSELTEDEMKQRKQIGLIAICWATIGSAAVVYSLVESPSAFQQYVLPLIVGGVVAGLVFGVFLKK
jgi:hypothetical protein